MWNPTEYLAFSDHRSRPFSDLLARVGAEHPREVVDLGCGPGTFTATLAVRWPDARVVGIDSSPEMVAAAATAGVPVALGDLAEWTPTPATDVVVSNAALQWVPEHPDLLRTWVRALPPGAWLAFQVPGNFAAPSHQLVRALATGDAWSDRVPPLRGEETVLPTAAYADLFPGCDTDTWETTYLHRLTGEDPVLDWISGTALRPVRAALTPPDWTAFRAALAPALREAYPVSPDGSTPFPFRRVFTVVRTP